MEKAEIAGLPIHDEREAMGRPLNDLEPDRPMIQIYQVPWHEMNVNDELTLRCEYEYCRGLEPALLRETYQ